MPTEKVEPTWYANIWIAGDEKAAIHACREFCYHEPLCVTVTPTSFVYKGGMEEGICVRLIQYPKFVKSESALVDTAKRLAEFLRISLYQDSFTIELPKETLWVTYRENDELR